VLGFVGTQDGKKNCHLWAGAYFEGYSTTGNAAGEVNKVRVAHSRKHAARLEAESGKHPLGKFVDDGKETDAKLNVYTALMAGLNFLVIAAGLGVLNIAMASFLIASGVFPEMIDEHWRAHVFAVLPLTLVFCLKRLAFWFSPPVRKRYALILAAIGILAAVVWGGAFAVLFYPAPNIVHVLPKAGISPVALIGITLLASQIVGECAIAAFIGLTVEESMRNRRKSAGRYTGEAEFFTK
jgi:hypothetical protein